MDQISLLQKSIELITKLVSYPSITPIDAGCIDFIADYLDKLGFAVQWLNSGNIKNLYAKKGNGQLCFAGHTDVVPTGTGWLYDPFNCTKHEQHLIGRGTADMKGSIGCFLAILEHNKHLTNISVLLTTDEEAQATHGLRTCIDFLKTQPIELFLLGEPTSLQQAGDCFKIGRRGSVTFDLVIYGKQGHIAYPHFAINPIDLAEKVFAVIEKNLENTDDPRFGACKAVRTSIDVNNQAENVIPYAARMRFGIRLNKHHTCESVKKLVEQACTQVLDKFELTAHLHGNAFVIEDESLLQKLSQLFPNAIFDAKGATSDGRFLTHIAPVIECGFLENQAHQINEQISLADIERLLSIYSIFLHELNSIKQHI